MKTALLDAVSPEAALQNVLERFSGVVPIGNGYKARCPAHDDRNPSLSIKDGHRGVLLKCWAGCALFEILQAIGLSESDLFYDAPDSRHYKTRGTVYEKANLHRRWDWRKSCGEVLVITECRSILAHDFLSKVRAIDSGGMTDGQRDTLLRQISLAWSWLRLAESAAELCHTIAQKMRREEKNG